MLIEDILETACVVFDIPRGALIGRSRVRHLVLARHAAITALLRRTRLSQVEVGKLFSDLDHTSVQHAVRACEKRCLTDADYRADVNALLDVGGPPPAPPAPRFDVRLRWALASYGGVPKPRTA